MAKYRSIGSKQRTLVVGMVAMQDGRFYRALSIVRGADEKGGDLQVILSDEDAAALGAHLLAASFKGDPTPHEQGDS